jgi:hypothetical protein
LDYEPGYFPRHWTDPKTEGALQKGYLAQTIIAQERKLGRQLNSEEVQEAIRAAIFHGKGKGKFKVSGSLKQRTIKRVPDSLLDFYADPLESLHSYLRLAAHDIERARFFRKFGYKGKLLTDVTDAGSRIDEVVQKEASRLGWSTDEMSDVTDMLRARFVEGEISPSRFIQNAKNIGYSTTLGNPLSAITQLGDQAFAMYKVGVRRASAEALRGLVGKREITKVDLGLTDAVEELFTNTSKTKTVLNGLLKYTGFNKIDQFGKENLMNATLKNFRKMVRTQKGQTKFAAKYSKFFENEMPGLVSDLKKGIVSDNVKLLMWHELADVQPISLSEMPQKYLSHPNGRVFYMLKTFTIKQVDFMRREIIQQFAKGHYVRGTKNLAAFTTFWLLANGTADGLKTVLTGEQFDVADNVVENMLQMVAWSKYSSLKTAKEGPMSAALDYIMPPKLIEPIPFVGKIISKAIRAQERQKKRIRQGVAARLR